MKVLLIWEEVPEKISAYVLEGEDAEIALAAHGKYINSDDDETVEKLGEILAKYEPVKSDEPFSVENVDKIVFSGMMM